MDYVMRRRSTCRQRIRNVVVTVTVTLLYRKHLRIKSAVQCS